MPTPCPPRAVKTSLSLLCAELRGDPEPQKKRSKLAGGTFGSLQGSPVSPTGSGGVCSTPKAPRVPPVQGPLPCVVTHGVSQLKQKVKSKGLPPGLSPFRRRDPNPGARIQKKLNRPKGSKGSKYQGQDPGPRQPPHFRGKAGTGMGCGIGVGVRGLGWE